MPHYIQIDRLIMSGESEWTVRISNQRGLGVYRSYNEARNRAETLKFKTGLEIKDLYLGFYIKQERE